jgi:hypothetical protein
MRCWLLVVAVLVAAPSYAQQPPNCPLSGAIVAPDGTVWICRGPAQAPMQVSTGGGEGVPAGASILIDSGTCPSGYEENTALNGKTLIGTLAANKNVGTTGGADTITPAGTNSAPTFTGTAWSAPALSWPAGVPTFAGTLSTTVVNHVHTLGTGTGTTGNFAQVIGTVDTSSGGTGGAPTQTALGTLSGNPTAGGAANYTPAGTVAWPAGVPTIGAYTPLGTVTAPTFTGTPFDNRSAFTYVIVCRKT